MTFAVQVKKREPGDAASLRTQGQIPAVVYGPQMTSVPVVLTSQAFHSLYKEAGDSTLIDLTIDTEAPAKVLIQEIQHDPVTGRVTHVDFRQINMKKEMQTSVDLRFVGEAPAVKELGGTLVKPLARVNVKCLPSDLMSHIDVDLKILKTFAEVIRVSDLPIGPGITILDNPAMTVAKVTAPLTEDELKALEASSEPVDLSKIEVSVEKGKKEEEGEEGAEAAADGKAEAPAAKKEKE